MDKANADYELSDKNQSLQLRLIFGSDKVSKCLSVWHKVLSQLSLSAFSHNFFSSVSLLTFSGIFISLFSHLSITIYVNNCVCPVLFPPSLCYNPESTEGKSSQQAALSLVIHISVSQLCFPVWLSEPEILRLLCTECEQMTHCVSGARHNGIRHTMSEMFYMDNFNRNQFLIINECTEKY